LTSAGQQVEPADEMLARRAASGCERSFEEVVRRYQVPLILTPHPHGHLETTVTTPNWTNNSQWYNIWGQVSSEGSGDGESNAHRPFTGHYVQSGSPSGHR